MIKIVISKKQIESEERKMRNRFLSLFVVATVIIGSFTITSNVYAHDNIDSKEEVASKQRLETDKIKNSNSRSRLFWRRTMSSGET